MITSKIQLNKNNSKIAKIKIITFFQLFLKLINHKHKILDKLKKMIIILKFINNLGEKLKKMQNFLKFLIIQKKSIKINKVVFNWVQLWKTWLQLIKIFFVSIKTTAIIFWYKKMNQLIKIRTKRGWKSENLPIMSSIKQKRKVCICHLRVKKKKQKIQNKFFRNNQKTSVLAIEIYCRLLIVMMIKNKKIFRKMMNH